MSWKTTPVGRLPVTLSAGTGKPLVVTRKLEAAPTAKVAAPALVMAGASFTVSVKDWVASGLTPFAAVMVSPRTPPPPAAGVPASVAVPSPLSTKVMPDGNEPTLVRLGTGKPLVVTMKLPGLPTVKVAWSAPVIAGGWSTAMGAVTVWPSRVAEAPPSPGVTPAVKLAVAIPPVS